MGSLPLHPMIVHLPIALALLMPLVAVVVLAAWWREKLPAGAWALVLLLQALLVGSAYVAIETGENEEDRVERVVAERAIHEHEEAAEVFLWGAGGVLILTGLALFVPGAAAKRGLALLAIAGMAVVIYLGVRVGEAGGELVYVHGAAAAYGAPAAPGAAGEKGALPKTGRGEESEDEHDDD